MTEFEEKEYLIDLLFEAARWRVDHDDPRCAIELEIRDRLRRLSGIDTVDENGEAQGELEVSTVLTEDDYKDLEAAKLNEHLASPNKIKNAKERWKQGRVRVIIDGKPTWKLASDCHKEIIPGFEKKWHWVWNGQDYKNQQCDAMWAEHEQEGS